MSEISSFPGVFSVWQIPWPGNQWNIKEKCNGVFKFVGSFSQNSAVRSCSKVSAQTSTMWLFAPKLLGRFGSLSFLESFLQIRIWLYQRCTFSSWFAEFPVTQAPIWISSVLCLLNALRGLHNLFLVNTDRSDPYSSYSKHTAYDFGHLTFSAEHPKKLWTRFNGEKKHLNIRF